MHSKIILFVTKQQTNLVSIYTIDLAYICNL